MNINNSRILCLPLMLVSALLMINCGGSSSGGESSSSVTESSSAPIESSSSVADSSSSEAESSSSASEGSSSSADLACVGDYEAGSYPPDIADETAWLTIDGVEGQPGPRSYKVHVPTGYDCTQPTPLLVCLHGFQQTGVMFCVNGTAGENVGSFVEKSDEEGFILLIPTGDTVPGPDSAWSDGALTQGGTDDVALMRALVEEVSTHANVDPDRVYATGFSNGGFMSLRLACDAADVFSAVAAAAGAVFSACTPSQPVSMLAIHGVDDPTIPYTAFEPTHTAFAAANDCDTVTEPADVPAVNGDESSCITYTGCPTGVSVTGCSVANGGHVWFGDPTCGTGAGPETCDNPMVGTNSTDIYNTDAVWSFFESVSRE